ncbi:juvenile hormone acid O-methyltransferase-like [Chironomus tepperi]|uniref:juvenile hormone acid O-methyltransferase-like n=1 Tax=Chironomus tepperi TaxID=113505 RepID=UPI00391F3CBB
MYKAKLYSVNNYEQTDAVKKFYDTYGDRLRNEFGLREISLIDIGAGCGSVLSELTLKNIGLNFSSVVGVDRSHEMIKFSNEKYGSDYVKFMYMDAEGDIPDSLNDKHFDMATSFYVYQFMKDLRKAFKNVYDLLNPGGVFCCMFLGWHLIADLMTQLDDKYSPYTNNWMEEFYPLWLNQDESENLTKKYLTEVGFEIIEFNGEENEFYDYQHLGNFKKAMKAVIPFLKKMPETLQDEYMDDIAKVLLSTKSEDPLYIPRKLYRFIAKK